MSIDEDDKRTHLCVDDGSGHCQHCGASVWDFYDGPEMLEMHDFEPEKTDSLTCCQCGRYITDPSHRNVSLKSLDMPNAK